MNKLIFWAVVLCAPRAFADVREVEETGAVRTEIISQLRRQMPADLRDQLERVLLGGASLNLMCDENNPGHGGDVGLDCKVLLYESASRSAVPYVQFTGSMDAGGETVQIDKSSIKGVNFP